MLCPLLLLTIISSFVRSEEKNCVFDECDGDMTGKIQNALDRCDHVRISTNCTSGPLAITSRRNLTLEIDGILRVGEKWDSKDGKTIEPFISFQNSSNISMIGSGIVDGRGAMWWPTSIIDPPRPRLVVFQNCQDVRIVGNFTLLNSPFWTLLLNGENFFVSDIRIRAPSFQIARNTDGIDIAAKNVHIRNVDIANGDDSICVKSPSSNVLVESSIVSLGNGLVVGTAGNGLSENENVAEISNITFRNCIANDTTFGCHIKFKPPQHGYAKNILFENVTIYQSVNATNRRVRSGDHAGYVDSLCFVFIFKR